MGFNFVVIVHFINFIIEIRIGILQRDIFQNYIDQWSIQVY